MVVSGECGKLAIWNIRSCKQKYVSTVFEGCAITVLMASPAVDVIAVGFADGRIAVHNIKVDKVRPVCAWEQSSSGVCTTGIVPIPPPFATLYSSAVTGFSSVGARR